MSSQRVEIDQVKEQLSDLIAAASEGSEIVIVENGKPLARLVPATDTAIYKAYPPAEAEFSSDENSLSWEADGWENVA